MQQMRDGANFPADLLHHCGVLGNGAGSCGIELIGLMLHDSNVHAERGEKLPHAVMQLSRDVPALFIADLLQPARELAQAFVRQVQVCGSFPDFLIELVMRSSELLFSPLTSSKGTAVCFTEGDD